MNENKKNYYIFLGDMKVDVSEEIYKGYWQETNRENYLKRLDKENRLGYFSEFLLGEIDRSIEERLIEYGDQFRPVMRNFRPVNAE